MMTDFDCFKSAAIGIFVIVILPAIIIKLISNHISNKKAKIAEKYNEEIKRKLEHVVEYIFGKEIGYCISVLDEYGIRTTFMRGIDILIMKMIFIDKKDIKKMRSFTESVFEKYNCHYTCMTYAIISRINQLLTNYKSLEDYLYQIANYNTSSSSVKTFIDNNSEEFCKIAKDEFMKNFNGEYKDYCNKLLYLA